MRAVAALLSRHGADVLAHRAKSFVADLSTARNSAGFARQQQSVFENLAKVPLSRWSYAVGSRTDDRGSERTATKKYGTPAIIVRLTLRYALRGVDRRPTTHDLWWTFIQQDGKIVIAGDADLAQGGGKSWQGPWDFGPLDVVRGPTSLILGHPDNAAALPAIAATVSSAVPAVSAVVGTHWARDVAVLIPSSSAELSAEAATTATVSSAVAAVAVSDGVDAPSNEVLGQRLIINPSAVNRLSAVGRQIVVRHEITHIAAAAFTFDSSPRWVVEGFADYVGNLGSGQPVTVAAAELRADVRRAKLPTTLPTGADFDTAGMQARSYESAWLACRLIAARAGQSGLVRFYRLVGAQSAGATSPIAGPLRAVLHESPTAFVPQWRAYLRAQLGG